jgi:hypothetical protein
VELLRKYGSLSVKEIATLLNPGVEMTAYCKEYKSAKQLIFKAKQAGRIEQRFDGKYQVAGKAVFSENFLKVENDVNK